MSAFVILLAAITQELASSSTTVVFAIMYSHLCTRITLVAKLSVQ